MRVYLIQIGLRSHERGIVLRDVLDLRVCKDVPLDFQLSRLLVNSAEIADL